MFNVGLLLLAMGLFGLIMGIGLYFEKPLVKLYETFDGFMECLLEKIFE